MTTEFTMEGTQEIEIAGHNFTAEFEADVEVQYDPGRVSGPPEHCYPPSGEVTFNAQRLTSLKDFDGNEVGVNPHAMGRILAKIDWASVEADVWEKFFAEFYAQGEGPEEPRED